MIQYYPLTMIEGIDLFLTFPTYPGEATLYMQIEGKMIEITMGSHEYELGWDEYFLNMNNLNEYVEYSCPNLDELGEVEPLSFFQKLKLKPQYEEIILKWFDQHKFG